MPNSDREGGIFLTAPNNHDKFFFLHTSWSLAFDFQYKSQHLWVTFLYVDVCHMDRVKRIWYLSPMRAAKVRCSLIQALSQEEPSDRKLDPWPLWIAGHAQLKFVMMECSKTQIHLTGPILKVNSICYITMTSTPNVCTTKLRDLYNQCIVILFSFDLGLRLFHYFTYFAPRQLLGGVKTGDPLQKPPDHPQAEHGSSQTWARLQPSAVRWRVI